MTVPVCLTNSYPVDVGESQRILETIVRAAIGTGVRSVWGRGPRIQPVGPRSSPNPGEECWTSRPLLCESGYCSCCQVFCQIVRHSSSPMPNSCWHHWT